MVVVQRTGHRSRCAHEVVTPRSAGLGSSASAGRRGRSRRSGLALRVGVDVRVDAERRVSPARRPRAGPLPTATPSKPALPRSTISTAAPSGRACSAVPASCASWPAARSMPSTLEPSSRSSKSATRRPLLRPQAAELLPHGLRAPHICVVSTRPVRSSRSTSSPAMPWSSSSFSVPCVGGAAPRGRTGGRP